MADGLDIREQVGKGAVFEPRRDCIVVLVDAGKRARVAARDAESAIRKDPLVVGKVAKDLLHGPFSRGVDTNATILFPTAAVQSNYGLAYLHVNPAGIRNPDGSLYRFGQPLPANQLPAGLVFPPNEVASPRGSGRTPSACGVH